MKIRMNEPSVKEQIKDRRIFLACCMLWFFLSGVEYAIVLPTVHFYLDSIGAETFYIGFVIGSLSLGAMISAPIYAAITDHFKKAIYIIRVGMIFSIGGSCLYFLLPQKNIIVLARFIGGVGWGLEGALMGQIGRTFSQDNKTSKFAAVLMMRQFGVLVGPIMIYALPKMAFTAEIGSWTLIVSEYSAAGLLLAVAWTIAWIIMLIFYKDPVAEDDVSYSQIDTTAITSVADSLLQIQEVSRSMRNINSNQPQKLEEKKYRYNRQLGVLHEPIIVAAFCTFSTYILQSGMETLVSPFTHYFLGWGMKQNAIMYISVGTIALSGYLSMQFVSKKLDDRVTLLMGCVILTGVLVTVMGVYPFLTFRAEWIYPIFGVAILAFCWFLPYVVVSAAAILSKSATKENQSTVQTVRTTGEVLAQVLSPFWVGQMLNSRWAVLVWQLGFMALCSVLVLLSWQVLKPEEAIQYKEPNEGSIVRHNLEDGLEEMDELPPKDHNTLPKRLMDGVTQSHTSIPSSVMCSLASIKS